jgi:predicted enzyme related to lactoylglutathione lyase
VTPIPASEQRSSSIMHFAMTVDDIDEAAYRIEHAGGRVLMKPGIVAGAPTGPRFVYCESPEGHQFELVTVDHHAVITFVRDLRGEPAT